MTKSVGIAGIGAIGKAVGRALTAGIEGFHLQAVSDPHAHNPFPCPNVDFEELIDVCDLIIECLPPAAVPELAQLAFAQNKDLILISASALLMHPDILDQRKRSSSRIIVPSGALAGIDGVSALKQLGIKSAKIATTKKPIAYDGAPFIIKNGIKLNKTTEKTRLFSGNALEAAQGFPANINVAATLSLAGIGPEKTRVEIWADPAITGNCHEIEVIGEFSTIVSRVHNTPDPANPKSSMLAAQSIVATLRAMGEPLAIL